MSNTKTYEQATVKKLPHAEVEIELIINAETLDHYKQQALDALIKTTAVDGFRPGHAPRDTVEKHVGQDTLLKEASERAIQNAYPDVIQAENIKAIGYPSVSITKLAWGNPLTATLRTATMPEITLADYKKIARAHQKEGSSDPYEATDKEVDDVILELRKSKAHSDWHKANPKDTDHHNHPDFDTEENLPILNEAFVSSLGPFKTVEELRAQVAQNIIREKEMKDAEKRRVALFDELIDKTKAEIPHILVEGELAKMIAGLKDDVARANISFEDYLKEIKKTEDDIRTEWRPGAERRAKMQLIMNHIADAEHITADQTIVEHEVKKLLDMYSDADPDRARVYVETTLINEAVVKFLEGTPEK